MGEDWSWIVPGEDYPLMIEKHDKWIVRELHFNEAVEIAREAVKRCLLDPPPTRENLYAIPAEKLFILLVKILQLTEKSQCMPHFKRLLNLNRSGNPIQISSKELEALQKKKR